MPNLTYRDSGSASTASSGSTLPCTVGASGNVLGDPIIVGVSCSIAGDVTSVTDSNANVYTRVDSETNGLYNLYVYACPSNCASITGTLTVTANLSTTGLVASIQALEYIANNGISGSGWALLDSHNEATGTTNPTVNITTVAASTMIVAFAVGDNTSTPTNGTGFTTRQSGTATGLAFIAEEKSESAAGTYAAAANGVGLTTSTIIAVAFTLAPAPALVQSNVAYNFGTTSCSSGFNVTPVQTAGNTNVVMVSWPDATSLITSVTDTYGNTYVTKGNWWVAGNGITMWFYVCYGIVSGAGANTIKVTFNANVSAELIVQEWQNGGVDNAVVTFADGNSASASVGPITTDYVHEMLVAYMWTNAAGVAVTSGWSAMAPGNNGTNGVLGSGSVIEYEFVASAGTSVTPTVALTGSNTWMIGVLGFSYNVEAKGTSTATGTAQAFPNQPLTSATAGEWDEELLNLEWFDVDNYNAGWVSRDFVVVNIVGMSDVVPMIGGGRNPRNSTYLKM